MRGTDERSGSRSSCVDREERVPARHPLRKIRPVVDEATASLDAGFEALSIMSRTAKAAILAQREVAPLVGAAHFPVDGRLVKALAIGPEPWRHPGSRSTERFQPKPENAPPEDVMPGTPPGRDTQAKGQPEQIQGETDTMPCPSRHNRNAEVDFGGQKGSNSTHAATTDPDARRCKKSRGTRAMPCIIGHPLMEYRSQLIVQADLTRAGGRAGRKAALDMVHRPSPGPTRRLTLGAGKGFGAAALIAGLREACVAPHVTQTARSAAIDGRTTRHQGHALSIRRRKRIEAAFGWAGNVDGMARTVGRGRSWRGARAVPLQPDDGLADISKNNERASCNDEGRGR